MSSGEILRGNRIAKKRVESSDPAKSVKDRNYDSSMDRNNLADLVDRVGKCAVCFDKANGNFFGASVCLACKSFFIRCTKDGFPVIRRQCSGSCDVSKPLRSQCQHCRFQRCVTIGMTRKEKPMIVQPQIGQESCRVCQDLANGVHFGIFTCEGCKKFFRRSLKERSTYVCQSYQVCQLNPRNRNNCRYCRFQKCLAVGMSRDAIKMGRPRKIICDSKIKASVVELLKLSTDEHSPQPIPVHSQSEKKLVLLLRHNEHSPEVKIPPNSMEVKRSVRNGQNSEKSECMSACLDQNPRYLIEQRLLDIQYSQDELRNNLQNNTWRQVNGKENSEQHKRQNHLFYASNSQADRHVPQNLLRENKAIPSAAFENNVYTNDAKTSSPIKPTSASLVNTSVTKYNTSATLAEMPSCGYIQSKTISSTTSTIYPHPVVTAGNEVLDLSMKRYDQEFSDSSIQAIFTPNAAHAPNQISTDNPYLLQTGSAHREPGQKSSSLFALDAATEMKRPRLSQEIYIPNQSFNAKISPSTMPNPVIQLGNENRKPCLDLNCNQRLGFDQRGSFIKAQSLHNYADPDLDLWQQNAVILPASERPDSGINRYRGISVIQAPIVFVNDDHKLSSATKLGISDESKHKEVTDFEDDHHLQPSSDQYVTISSIQTGRLGKRNNSLTESARASQIEAATREISFENDASDGSPYLDVKEIRKINEMFISVYSSLEASEGLPHDSLTSRLSPEIHVLDSFIQDRYQYSPLRALTLWRHVLAIHEQQVAQIQQDEPMPEKYQWILQNVTMAYEKVLKMSNEDRVTSSKTNGDCDSSFLSQGGFMIWQQIKCNTQAQIRFTFSIPGMELIHPSDRIQLMHGDALLSAALLMAAMEFYDPTNNAFCNFWNEELAPDSPLFNLRFRLLGISQQFHALHLDHPAMALLYAHNLLCRENADFKNLETIQTLCNDILKTLGYYLKCESKAYNLCQGVRKAMQMMPRLRLLGIWQFNVMKNIKADIKWMAENVEKLNL